MKPHAQIISVSRKTDIPAFYHEWFFNRLKEGFVLYRNPFNAHKFHRVSLLPNDVHAFVFWTRNAEYLLPRLSELEQYIYYFQYTITGYPRALEKSTPNPHRAIATFQQLSRQIGKERVIWRYDPILLCNLLPIQEHKRLFQKIAENLAGYTDKVIISFADLYAKTERNLKKIDIKPIGTEHFEFTDILKHETELADLVGFMAQTAQLCGMQIETCAETVNLEEKYGIRRGLCIDNQLLERLFGDRGFSNKKDKGQRAECGCVQSRDIGIYDTCVHGCQYCYATTRHDKAAENKRQHNPHSPLLLGEIEDIPEAERDNLLSPPQQDSLFSF
ncbi:DUF1848 domain-containing protein [Conchiformibius steedae]|uniref:DUF1848 domain-containing protein n=1 Tax=Conchiformibius steedae TaxID=153493 RepID=A0A3P2A869_9NEIS|nr:DUF1848 domain-containing protein [Conchiformibius steedae]RRD91692.1 DUF1848 domain-containing protein [Conchiformibius steedae]